MRFVMRFILEGIRTLSVFPEYEVVDKKIVDELEELRDLPHKVFQDRLQRGEKRFDTIMHFAQNESVDSANGFLELIYDKIPLVSNTNAMINITPRALYQIDLLGAQKDFVEDFSQNRIIRVYAAYSGKNPFTRI